MTEQEIEQIALQLFREYGIKNISMDDIAQRSGVSKRTLYELYNTREHLMGKVLNAVLENFRSAVKLIILQHLDPVKTIVKIYGLFIQQARDAHPVFLHSIRKYYPVFTEHYHKFIDEIINRALLPQFKKARQSGIIRQDVNLQLLFDLHRKHFDDIIHGNPHTGKIDNYEALFQQVVVNNLRGLLTKEHYHLLDNKIDLMAL